MQIQLLTQARAEDARALWNRGAGKEYPHKPLTEAEFAELFCKDETYVAYLAVEQDRVVGFAAGNARLGTMRGDKGYLSALVVEPLYRRQGIGTALLQALEKALLEMAPKAALEVSFFNPAALTWLVPGTDGHDHPNAPGVDLSSPLYLFLENRGYRAYAHENSYYLPLKDYVYPAEIETRMQRLAQKHNIHITFYDPKVHTGLEELVENLQNEDWKRDVLAEVAREDGGRPLLIAEHEGRAIGFTGPLDVQPSGRGFFLGIGVHSDYRGVGAGKCLFAALCKGLQGIHAQFMTLFTGEENPARGIYEAAGFKIVKTWMDMRKEV